MEFKDTNMRQLLAMATMRLKQQSTEKHMDIQRYDIYSLDTADMTMWTTT